MPNYLSSKEVEEIPRTNEVQESSQVSAIERWMDVMGLRRPPSSSWTRFYSVVLHAWRSVIFNMLGSSLFSMVEAEPGTSNRKELLFGHV